MGGDDTYQTAEKYRQVRPLLSRHIEKIHLTKKRTMNLTVFRSMIVLGETIRLGDILTKMSVYKGYRGTRALKNTSQYL
jgi:hypothetical protein